MPEYLHLISHRFLGQPGIGNRWDYPDIFLWSEDSRGETTIPCLIAFYFNRTFLYSREKRWAFERQLQDHFPVELWGRWYTYWMFSEGYIWAERLEEGMESYLPAELRKRFERAGIEYDEFVTTELQSTNGHKEVENAHDLLMVPQPESD